MKKLLAVFAVGLFQVAAIQATPALFKESIMYIKEGIVLLGEEIRYYRNIQLQVTDKGEFRVIEGEALQPAQVEDATVAVLFTDPPQVELQISGNKSTPCVDLVTAVRRDNNIFYVAVAESPLQTFAVCVQVLEPYSLTTELDVSDLSTGGYQVRVNDRVLDFALQ